MDVGLLLVYLEGEKESNSQAKWDTENNQVSSLLNERANDKFLLYLGLIKPFSQMPAINKKLFLIQFGLQF